MTDVVLYGAPGCHLCDVAKAVLHEHRAALGYTLREVDISGDDELEARYRAELPVVWVAGRKAFKYRVDPVELARRVAVAGAAGGR